MFNQRLQETTQKEILEMATIKELEAYCLSRSCCLRFRRIDSRWLVRHAILALPSYSWDISNETYEILRTQLKGYLNKIIRKKYKNPIIIWILLNVFVPIVIRLVIDWWLNNQKNPIV